MFWRNKNKQYFQLYEEELDQIQDLIENKDEDDEVSDYGDSTLNSEADKPEEPDEADGTEEKNSQDQDIPGPEEELPEAEKKSPEKKSFMKGIFNKWKKTPADPVEEKKPETTGEASADVQVDEMKEEEVNKSITT